MYPAAVLPVVLRIFPRFNFAAMDPPSEVEAGGPLADRTIRELLGGPFDIEHIFDDSADTESIDADLAVRTHSLS
jgi:hypothetical protein